MHFRGRIVYYSEASIRRWLDLHRHTRKKYKRNRFSEEDLEDKLEHTQNIDIEKTRMKYEENFFVRHDKHISLKEKLKHRKEQLEEEHRRLVNAP